MAGNGRHYIDTPNKRVRTSQLLSKSLSLPPKQSLMERVKRLYLQFVDDKDEARYIPVNGCFKCPFHRTDGKYGSCFIMGVDIPSQESTYKKPYPGFCPLPKEVGDFQIDEKNLNKMMNKKEGGF